LYNNSMSTHAKYKTSPGCVHNINYHFVWCPKYRRKVLEGQVAKDLKSLIQEKATQIGVIIGALEVMPDHVHVFVQAPPTLSPHRIINQFKGFTSRILRQRHASLVSRLPTLWSRSYYVGVAGFVSESTIKAYIENQKGK